LLAATASGAHHRVYLWEVATGRLRRKVERGDPWRVASCFVGKSLITTGSGLLLWDARTGRLRRSLAQYPVLPSSELALSADGRTLAVTVGGYTAHPGRIELWDLPAGR